jgi:hypothetical protein
VNEINESKLGGMKCCGLKIYISPNSYVEVLILNLMVFEGH